MLSRLSPSETIGTSLRLLLYERYVPSSVKVYAFFSLASLQGLSHAFPGLDIPVPGFHDTRGVIELGFGPDSLFGSMCPGSVTAGYKENTGRVVRTFLVEGGKGHSQASCF